MIRFLVTYDQPADPEAFDRHYRTIHDPLTRRLPGLLAYTVHRQPRAIRGAAYYQVVELTWPGQRRDGVRVTRRQGHRGGYGQPGRAHP